LGLDIIASKVKERRVYISVLNWGLGHATRMVPVIQVALKEANYVVIGSNGQALQWLKKYFPEARFEETIPFEITYGNSAWQTIFYLFKKAITIASFFKKENNLTKQIVCKHTINLVISDNNPGVYYEKVENIYLTHQLNIAAPFGLGRILTRIHKKYYTRYQLIYVPDFLDASICLAGDLSRNLNAASNISYIGPLSRFMNEKYFFKTGLKNKYTLVLLSGPESAQMQYKNKMLKQALNDVDEWIFISNKIQETSLPSRIQFLQNPPDAQFAELITCAHLIYCRSGYSTLMDLYYLNKKAVLEPTPGQWEQEYLCNWYNTQK